MKRNLIGQFCNQPRRRRLCDEIMSRTVICTQGSSPVDALSGIVALTYVMCIETRDARFAICDCSAIFCLGQRDVHASIAGRSIVWDKKHIRRSLNNESSGTTVRLALWLLNYSYDTRKDNSRAIVVEKYFRIFLPL